MSIRTQLIVAFSGLFLLLLLVLLTINALFIDDYFIINNQENIKKNLDHILIEKQITDHEVILRDLDRRTGGEIFFIDDELNLIKGQIPIPNLTELFFEDFKFYKQEYEMTKKDYFKIIGFGSYQNRRLYYVRRLSSDEFLVVSKGLGLINESREVFLSFLIFGSTIVYLLSLVLIYIFSTRFTKPIITLKNSAESIAKLDFDLYEPLNTNNEIGQLSRSINTMSQELESNINKLSDTNYLLEQELSKERNMEKMRQQFISDVSHELKNPISMIIGYADGIIRGLPKTNDDKIYYAKVVLDEGKKMNRLVKDLLDLSSFNSNTMHMIMENVNLGSVVKNVIEKFEEQLRQKNINTSFMIEDDIIINGDQMRLEQVVINLIDNAIKHVEHSGTIRVFLTRDKSSIQLKISNTGNLITNSELDQIWQSFYQVNTDTEGSGLGLTIVKSIVERHKGYISVDVDKQMNHFIVDFRPLK